MRPLECKDFMHLIRLYMIPDVMNTVSKSIIWNPTLYDKNVNKRDLLAERQKIDRYLESSQTVMPSDLDKVFTGFLRQTNLKSLHKDIQNSIDRLHSELEAYKSLNLTRAMAGKTETQVIDAPTLEELYMKYNYIQEHVDAFEEWIRSIFEIMQRKIQGTSEAQVSEKLTIKSSNKYSIPEEETYDMVAEDFHYLDYGLTKDDFKPQHKKDESEWISVSDKKRKPKIGEKYIVCGYCYPGLIDYVMGIYEGANQWNTEYNDGNSPEFKVLFWRDIDKVEDAEKLV